jgi:hypothetical protein
VDVEALVDEFVQPAVDGLRVAAREHDRQALNAYAYELAILAGTLVGVARCPPPAAATVLPFERSPRPDNAPATR